MQENGLKKVEAYMHFIQHNAEMAVRTMLKEFATTHGTRAHAIDHMDDGTPIELTIDIDPLTGSSRFSFEGTGPQILGNINAPPAVTYSAVIYSLRSLVGQDIPLNQGCLAPIEFNIPQYSLLNPSTDAGVVGGNVLTSQRVVDVVLKAFKACAASQGCMNNLTFGDKKFGYYETIAGGAGAGPSWDGRSGVHTHCEFVSYYFFVCYAFICMLMQLPCGRYKHTNYRSRDPREKIPCTTAAIWLEKR